MQPKHVVYFTHYFAVPEEEGYEGAMSGWTSQAKVKARRRSQVEVEEQEKKVKAFVAGKAPRPGMTSTLQISHDQDTFAGYDTKGRNLLSAMRNKSAISHVSYVSRHSSVDLSGAPNSTRAPNNTGAPNSTVHSKVQPRPKPPRSSSHVLSSMASKLELD